jgi:GNAT superfamily N-acetyltransferase
MIRAIEERDLPSIVRVRTSVRENNLSVEAMAELGITPQSVWSELQSGELGGFLAEDQGDIAAFSMARHSDGSIFALFTQPEYEGRGYGSALLAEALMWLRSRGHREAWLSTGRGTKAEAFYRKRGWRGGEASPVHPEDVILRRTL